MHVACTHAVVCLDRRRKKSDKDCKPCSEYPYSVVLLITLQRCFLPKTKAALNHAESTSTVTMVTALQHQWNAKPSGTRSTNLHLDYVDLHVRAVDGVRSVYAHFRVTNGS